MITRALVEAATLDQSNPTANMPVAHTMAKTRATRPKDTFSPRKRQSTTSRMRTATMTISLVVSKKA